MQARGQGPEIVEDGRNPELSTDGSGEAHGRVEPRGETESHPHFVDAAGDTSRAEVGHHPQGFQHISRTNRRR